MKLSSSTIGSAWKDSTVETRRTLAWAAALLVLAILLKALSTAYPKLDSSLGNIVLGLVGAVLSPLFKLLIDWVIDLDKKRARSFFGINTYRQCEASNRDMRVYLQNDNVVSLLEQEYKISGAVDAVNHAPRARLFKARDWINSCDTDGARLIARRIREISNVYPDFKRMDRNKTTTPKSHGVEIYMGLGFTNNVTGHSSEAFSAWASIDLHEVYGDCLQISTRLVSKPMTSLSTVIVKRDRERVAIVPRNWTHEGFVAESLSGSALRSRDYALILRHSIVQENKVRKVVFWCAGFTQHGTFHAGKYLANNWLTLLRKASEGRNAIGGYGDFLAIITGFSMSSEWTGDPELFVTPATLIEAFGRSANEHAWIRRWVDS